MQVGGPDMAGYQSIGTFCWHNFEHNGIVFCGSEHNRCIKKTVNMHYDPLALLRMGIRKP